MVQFTCYVCERTFNRTNPEEEAMDTWRRDFPAEAAANEARALVCSQCYATARRFIKESSGG